MTPTARLPLQTGRQMAERKLLAVLAGSRVWRCRWPALTCSVVRAQGQAGLVRATQAGAASLSLNLTLPADSGTQGLVPAGSPARAGPIPGGGSSTLATGSSLTSPIRIYRWLNLEWDE